MKFQSFCIVGFLWKAHHCTWKPKSGSGFNPSVSLDSSGSQNGFHRIFGILTVSILLYRWIPLEVRCRFIISRILCVSILLYRWIPLEAVLGFFGDFNMNEFQSFCIVGFLWKYNRCPNSKSGTHVSILLYRWIPLEVAFRLAFDIPLRHVSILLYRWIPLEVLFLCCQLLQHPHVSILLYRWIPLEAPMETHRKNSPFLFQSFCIVGFLWKGRRLHLYRDESQCFNPSVSLDSSGSEKHGSEYIIVVKFQSFCIVGFLWKRSDVLSVRVPGKRFQSFCIVGFLWKSTTVSGDATGLFLFQSFCIVGFLWKFYIGIQVQPAVPRFQSFCIVGFLWKNDWQEEKANFILFQSFCIVGFLWKR